MTYKAFILTTPLRTMSQAHPEPSAPPSPDPYDQPIAPPTYKPYETPKKHNPAKTSIAKQLETLQTQVDRILANHPTISDHQSTQPTPDERRSIQTIMEHISGDRVLQADASLDLHTLLKQVAALCPSGEFTIKITA
jgi:hypothetical protein